MARRIWVIKKTTEVTPEVRADAIANNCPEIAMGTPPALKKILAFRELPLAYEEPEGPPAEPPRDLAAEIDALKEDIDKLKEVPK